MSREEFFDTSALLVCNVRHGLLPGKPHEALMRIRYELVKQMDSACYDDRLAAMAVASYHLGMYASSALDGDVAGLRSGDFDGAISKRFVDYAAGIHVRKDRLYGNSWSDELDLFGTTPLVIRLYEKLGRVLTLLDDENIDCDDEPILDTLTDSYNYIVMTAKWDAENNNNKR